MKKLILTVLVLVFFASPIYAQMSTGQGGGMMGGGWGWGFGIIIAILVVVVVAYMMKRR
jgi:uncharacterized membrane protein